MGKAHHINNQLINPWTIAELHILETVKNIPKDELLSLLPNRTWQSIVVKRKRLHLKPFIKRTPWNVGLTKDTSEIIARAPKKKSRPGYVTRDVLIKEKGKCEICGFSDERILIVHHKDCNRLHNKRENLIVLCPNCHTLEHLGKTGRLVLKSIRG